MTAIDIYEMFCDMDYRDYIETMENDIDYINTLIKKYGDKKALQLLTDMMFN